MKFSQEQLNAIRKKKGLLNLTSLELSKQSGVSRETLRPILKGTAKSVHTKTYNKMMNWLVKDI